MCIILTIWYISFSSILVTVHAMMDKTIIVPNVISFKFNQLQQYLLNVTLQKFGILYDCLIYKCVHQYMGIIWHSCLQNNMQSIPTALTYQRMFFYMVCQVLSGVETIWSGDEVTRSSVLTFDKSLLFPYQPLSHSCQEKEKSAITDFLSTISGKVYISVGYKYHLLAAFSSHRKLCVAICATAITTYFRHNDTIFCFVIEPLWELSITISNQIKE